MLQEEVNSCPVCKSSTFQDLHVSKDFTVTGELFHVKQCTTCGLGVTSPRPNHQNASAYYKSEKYISHSAKSSGLFDSIYLIIRYFTLKWKYSLVNPFLHGGPILDYGCGTGHFLKELKKRGVNVFGVEPSAEARSKISANIPVSDSLTTLTTTGFRVITLWHVLEHVYSLRDTINALKERLEDNGTIFIAVPNWESHDANYYGTQWAAWDVPRHLWHFTKASMSMLLQESGLRIQKIIPMNLDAYYVSLLSAKYSNGGKFTLSGALRAMAVAFRSNQAGAKTKNQSSLIFVVQKR